MNKNDIIEITVTDISADGSGIGKYNGMAVFVPLTAVGDSVVARVLKVKKNYAFAKAEQIIHPSEHRTNIDCSVFNRCGGCVFRHIDYRTECDIKQNRVAQTMRRIGKVQFDPKPIIAATNSNRYRNKALYPVAKNGELGFYSKRSHRVIPCGDCLLHPKEFADAADIFTNFVQKHNISVYDETTQRGLLRHFYLRYGFKTGEIMVGVVINGSELPEADQLVNRLKTKFGDNLKSVILNINTKNTNVVLGDKNVTVYGRGYIYDILCGVKVRISPQSFYQVNNAMAEKLYKKAAEYAEPDGKNILDLYCGAGTIGLSMAHEAKSVIGVEIISSAVKDARINAGQNNITNARFICGDASDAAEKLENDGILTDVVILDPPRKGCDESLLKTVALGFAPQKIVYVSCDVATLARDTAILEQFGFELKEYTPVDLFPRTAHVETVVLLSHKKPDGHINVKVEFGEGEGKVPLDNIAKRAEEYKPKERVTYKMIKEYIEAKYGFKVHTAYIAEVKRDLGLPMYDAPNAVEELKQPRKHPTAEKVEAIKDALKHFEVI